MSGWSSWSACSATCGGGSQRQTRSVTKQPAYGGNACPTLVNTQNCNMQPCPIKCVVTSWSAWSACSKTCGTGVRVSTRSVVVFAAHGGTACPSLTQSQQCNTQPCPINCAVSGWSAWSTCSAVCGGGVQKQTRTITRASAFGGTGCPNLSQQQACNTQACPHWKTGAWSSCSKTCGSGVQTRSVTCSSGSEAQCAASEYKAGSKPVASQACNIQACPINCAVGAWSAWTACPVACGTGRQTRTRPVTKQPAFGGVACPAVSESQICNSQPCPINCAVGGWSAWSACSKTCGGGVQTQTRSVTVAAAHGGKACPVLIQSQKCNTQRCPINCVVNGWSAWSTCSKTCGSGLQTSTRTVAVAAANGGVSCPSLNREQSCNTQPCPVNCVVSGWSAWSACDKACGTGTQRQTRTILKAAAHGGAACPVLAQTQNCNTQRCPVNCVVSAWSAWSACSRSCGGGLQTSRRTVTVAAAHGGAACPALVQQQVCNTPNCPINCEVSAWSSWSSCSKVCGGGVQTQSRSVLTYTAYGGLPCPALTQTQSCNTLACPVNCAVGAWSAWSTCSKSCGGGVQSQSRGITKQPAFGGSPCPALTQTQACNTQNCPINCVVGGWSAWSACTETCGGGTRRQTRAIVINTAHGGQACPALSQTQNCNTQPCPVNCMVSGWSAWSACSAKCGGGVQTQTRTVTRAAAYGGSGCPVLQQSKSCNTQPCPFWKTGGWSTCNKQCGGGVMTRSVTCENGSEADCKAQKGDVKTFSDARKHCVDHFLAAYYDGKGNVHIGGAEPSGNLHTGRGDCGGVPQGWAKVLSVPTNDASATVTVELTGSGDGATCSGSLVMLVGQARSQVFKGCVWNRGGAQKPTVTTKVTYTPGDSIAPTATQPCNTQACPINCAVGRWSAWSACSARCGGGSQTQTRAITAQQANGGASCPALTQSQRCNTQPCPINCVVGAWTAWSACTARCGTGSQTRIRAVVTPAAHGGAACPAFSETQACNTQLCPVDCKVSGWSSWSACSVTCGGGVTRQTRTVTRPAANGGLSCPSLTQQQSCNTQPCPVNCVVSGWSAWGVCSATCGGGSRSHRRSVITAAAHGGVACPALSESQACNTQPCAVNCEVSGWSSWSACSKACGGGSQTQTRSVVRNVAFGGNACPVLSQTQPCNTQPCPVNCVVGAWSAWTPCSKSCNGGVQEQTRKVLTAPAYGGTACPVVSRQQSCNSHSCPINCVVSAWSAWSKCTATCGGGTQKSTRTIITQSAFGGAACPVLSQTQKCNTRKCPNWVTSAWSRCSKTCGSGIQTRSVSCSDGNSADCLNANTGTFSSYDSHRLGCFADSGNRDLRYLMASTGDMSVMKCHDLAQAAGYSYFGVQYASECWADNRYGTYGASSNCNMRCSGDSSHTCGGTWANNVFTTVSEPPSSSQTCNTHACPVNCAVSGWSTWSACSATCGGGKQTRTRSVTTQSANGGAACPATAEQRACNTQACPINCAVGPWSSWSACSKACNGGSQTQTRSITVNPAFGGAACPALAQTQACNTRACPVDCIVSGWSSWSACSAQCNGGSQIKTRSVITRNANGGAACPSLSESQSCNTRPCAVHCQVSAWSTWSSCSKACGGGSQAQTRSVIVRPAFGGNACPTLTQIQSCNMQACPIDCKVSAWSAWSACSLSCGSGSQRQTRTVVTAPAYGGAACPALSQMQACNTQACPRNCAVSAWSAWSACSQSCGSGVRTQSRSVLVSAANGGAACPALTQTQPCNTHACPRNCVVSGWSAWSACSAQCGGGKQTSTRAVTVASANGGIPCPVLTRSQSCNTQDCPHWDTGAWSVCSKTCGGGTQTRSVTCSDGHEARCLASRGAKPVAKQACNSAACAINCVVGAWTAWSACSATCNGGRQTRTRPITVQAANGGVMCPALTESQACNQQPCPRNCVVSAWSAWSACSKSCGSGVQTQSRSVVTAPAFGGQSCPSLIASQPCNTHRCPVNCVVSGWSAWSACSKTCGGGKQRQTRTVSVQSANGGVACPSLVEERSCNVQACPVNCVVSAWSAWSICSHRCGGGLQTQSRSVTVPSANGGAVCPTLSQTQSCNTQPCPVDCQVGAWTAWSTCSKICGGGIETQTRTVTRAAAYGGAGCPALSQSQACNTQACPVNCAVGPWSAWSTCSAACNGGSQIATRTVTSPARNGGAACPALSQVQSCNTHKCPVNCQVSTWSAWSKCTKTCGGGIQTATRTVLVNTNFGGAACPVLSQTQACNTQRCPNWVTGAWSACSKTCGGGVQTRSVECSDGKDADCEASEVGTCWVMSSDFVLT